VAGKVGLIGDTHDDIAPWQDVLSKVAPVFDGVDLILHCGDLTTTGVLDDLAQIAPVVAVRSQVDPAAEPPRLVEGPHFIESEGTRIGLVNTLGDHDPETLFSQRIDVLVHGGTHEASIEHRGPLLLVNPGSPSLAQQVTVAILTTAGPSTPSATIVPL